MESALEVRMRCTTNTTAVCSQKSSGQGYRMISLHRQRLFASVLKLCLLHLLAFTLYP